MTITRVTQELYKASHKDPCQRILFQLDFNAVRETPHHAGPRRALSSFNLPRTYIISVPFVGIVRDSTHCGKALAQAGRSSNSTEDLTVVSGRLGHATQFSPASSHDAGNPAPDRPL